MLRKNANFKPKARRASANRTSTNNSKPKKSRKDYHDEEYNRLLQSKRWRLLRKQVLEENKCLCRRCMEQGRVSLATTIHHITPVQWGVSLREKERLAFDRNNLMPLCDECHKEVHRTMGKQTLKANQAKLKAYLDDFRERFLE
ncbi:MAG: HNH endonuclease [Prevotella sp.]|nr:HNH endonuclease [Prevotella sp.]